MPENETTDAQTGGAQAADTQSADTQSAQTQQTTATESPATAQQSSTSQQILDGQAQEQVFIADLNALNNSGVDGFAIITQQDDTLQVNIVAEGLEANQPHAQHIHGFVDGTEATAATIEEDADNDGFVEIAESQTTGGLPLLNLTSPPTEAAEGDDGSFAGTADPAGYPTAPDGTLQFQETYTFDVNDPEDAALLESLGSLDKNVLELHGQTVAQGAGDGTDGEVDGAGGYLGDLPVAAGEIREVTGTAAVVATHLIDNLGEDPSSDEMANAFGIAQAVALLAGDQSDSTSTSDAGASSQDGSGTSASGGTSESGSSTASSEQSSADSGQMDVATADSQGDMMFA